MGFGAGDHGVGGNVALTREVVGAARIAAGAQVAVDEIVDSESHQPLPRHLLELLYFAVVFQ